MRGVQCGICRYGKSWSSCILLYFGGGEEEYGASFRMELNMNELLQDTKFSPAMQSRIEAFTTELITERAASLSTHSNERWK